MSYLIFIDEALTFFLNQLLPHNQLLNHLFSFFSLQKGFIFIWIFIIGIVLLIEESHHPGIQKIDKQFIFYFIVAVLFASVTSNYLLKPFFRRPRPLLPTITNDNEKAGLIKIDFSCPTDYSFPSTHAANAFAVATLLAYFDRKRQLIYYLTATVIAYSRLYLGCHYFFDAIVGAIIGFFLSKLLILIAARLRL